MGTSKSEYLQVSQSHLFTMSSTTAPVNTFNKSKEDFIWFVKKAVQDQKSYSYSEMYHCLLKMFVDADTNKDGLVSKSSFSKLIDAAASCQEPTDMPQRIRNYTRLRLKRML